MRALPFLLLVAGCRMAPAADGPAEAPVVEMLDAHSATDLAPSPPPSPAPAPEPQPLAFAPVDTTVLGGYGVFVETGVYHDGEAPARDGERWHALRPSDGGWTLVPVTVSVSTAQDVLLDPDDGPFTGRLVTTPATISHEGDWHEDPAVLFVRRNDGAWPAGPVRTAGQRLALDNAETVDLALGDRSYRLVVETGPPYASGGAERLVSLVGPDGARQRLARLPDADAGRLIWAGDLDADGRLDLVLDESWHYNLSAPSLWLSTEARPGDLVGRVARHESVGC